MSTENWPKLALKNASRGRARGRPEAVSLQSWSLSRDSWKEVLRYLKQEEDQIYGSMPFPWPRWSQVGSGGTSWRPRGNRVRTWWQVGIEE